MNKNYLEVDGLPPMPPPAWVRFGSNGADAYTAKQMQDYATEAVRAAAMGAGGLSLDDLDAAFEAEIKQITSVDCQANTMCRAFYGYLRKRIDADRPAASGAGNLLPGDWTLEWDRYSRAGTMRLASQKWGGTLLGTPKPGDIGLPALIYRLLADILAARAATGEKGGAA